MSVIRDGGVINRRPVRLRAVRVPRRSRTGAALTGTHGMSRYWRRVASRAWNESLLALGHRPIKILVGPIGIMIAVGMYGTINGGGKALEKMIWWLCAV